MRSAEDLKRQIRALDGRDYTACQSILGQYGFPDFELYIDRVPKDPYAPAKTGVYRVRVPRKESGLPPDTDSTHIRRVALCDYLARRFHDNCMNVCGGRRGTGNSGLITIAEPGQAVLERTSLVVNDSFVEARFFVGIPASGRKIRADIAETMLFGELPEIVKESLFSATLDLDHLYRHLHVVEDAEALRERLPSLGLVAFVADGAILPRASGVDRRPLESATVVPFRSPVSLRVSIKLPNAGAVTGMGVPEGVTLIVGGGYHGKSTLLQALEQGVYNHLPGDGREYCATLPGAVKVRASSGRSVVNTDISAFINDIPLGPPTGSFSTENASGSTSQAAFIAEAIEVGIGALIMDEDTCAANFLIRDKRMQRLVNKKDEPITAFIDRVRQLYEEHGISTVMVMGGSGDYFDVTDCVIQMIEFEPRDITPEAKAVAEKFPTGRAHEGGDRLEWPRRRLPVADGLDSRNDYGHFRISAPDPWKLLYGRVEVDLSDVEQLVETAQTTAVGRAIDYAKNYMDGKVALAEVVDRVMDDIRENGLDLLDNRLTGDLAWFRGLELAAALNRLRGFKARQGDPTLK